MPVTDQAIDPRQLLNNAPAYSFPSTPFENIGFALSGGGFRAAVYGLGVLSLMNGIKTEDGKTLLQKVKFVSSASGGTLVLAPYIASLHQGLSFHEFYRHVLSQTTGEDILQKAISLLNDESKWLPGGKARNLINAFARAYDDSLFSFIPEAENRTLAFIMNDEKDGRNIHLNEFCFNATEFYTGISFRFQGNRTWSKEGGPRFGNKNIALAGGESGVTTLKKIKLADVTAASSCFPVGFEPIVFPTDFAHKECPANELKDALHLLMHSWDDNLTPEQNDRSERAAAEHAFAVQGEFGLMDGGICDNQGLLSLLLANDRKTDAVAVNKELDEANEKEHRNRFDLMMVSDVTSHFMKPYQPAAPVFNAAWLNKPLNEYWNLVRSVYRGIKRILSLLWIAIVFLLVFAALPFVVEGASLAAVLLAILCLLLAAGLLVLKAKAHKVEKSVPLASEIFSKTSIQEVLPLFLKKDNFAGRTAQKVTGYLSGAPVSVLAIMLLARARSSITMVLEVFLKHVRRLIYELLYKNDRYTYRRFSNPIFKLSFTNLKNNEPPEFEPQEKEEKEGYEQRRQGFYDEVKTSCFVTDDIRTVAERAYNIGTALWFDKTDGTAAAQMQKDLVATGQITTCHSLLVYTLRLKHSRHFSGLEESYRNRINALEAQLKTLLHEFGADPFYLCKQMDAEADASKTKA